METKKLSRKDFLKSVGLLMGAAASAGIVSTADAASPPARPSIRTDKNGLTVRKRKYKYPWWVKTVDEITTETNPDIMEKSGVHYIAYGTGISPEEEWNQRTAQAKEFVKQGIINNMPGITGTIPKP